MVHAILDFLRTLTDPERLIQLLSGILAGWPGYALLFAIVFSETGLLVGFFLPGDSLLFTVGVVSGAGDYKPALILDRHDSDNKRVPVSFLGKVYCKVDAEYGSIRVGDLLTTSPTLGHAMKVSEPLNAFGAVIGKALRSLERGQGLIPMLVALQ